MKEEYIRAFNNTILGIVETDANGDQTVRAWPSRRILGYYRKSRDCTIDFYGRIISRGNTAVGLIYQNQNK